MVLFIKTKLENIFSITASCKVTHIFFMPNIKFHWTDSAKERVIGVITNVNNARKYNEFVRTLLCHYVCYVGVHDQLKFIAR